MEDVSARAVLVITKLVLLVFYALQGVVRVVAKYYAQVALIITIF